MSFERNECLGEVLGVDKKELYTVDPSTSLENVLKLLKEKNIISVPVFEKKTSQFFGIVDSFDLLRFGTAFNAFQEQKPDDSHFKQFDFGTATARDLLLKSPTSRTIFLFEPSETLRSAMKVLGTAHRALVELHNTQFTPEDNLCPSAPSYQILSQSDVVRFLTRNLKKLGGKINTRINELGLVNPLGDRDFPVASASERTISAFHRMFNKHVRALPVVDENGILIATLSASDLRGISNSSLSSVKLPVQQFLEVMQGGKPPHPVVCKSTSTLADVMLAVTTAKVHRVWVTDSKEQPIGVVTLTDIINTVLEISQSNCSQ
jgi:CBS domain-containing protein